MLGVCSKGRVPSEPTPGQHLKGIPHSKRIARTRTISAIHTVSPLLCGRRELYDRQFLVRDVIGFVAHVVSRSDRHAVTPLLSTRA